MKIVRRERRRFVYKNEVIAGLVFLILALLVFFGWKLLSNSFAVEVTFSVHDVEIRQDGDMPPFSIKATASKKAMKRVLDKKSGYTVADFIADMKAQKGCTVTYDTDRSEEGEFALKITLDDEIMKKITADWAKKLKLSFEEGTLIVKNKYGDWEGTKFKLLEEGYAYGWMEVQNHTYYFGEDGNYLVGEQEIDGRTYFFKDNGIFDDEKNKINPMRPVVALTFDDGPGPYTEELLDILEENDVPATFFLLGTRAKTYPSLVKRMTEIGCEVGNHSTNHPELTKISVDEIVSEISTANNAIKKACGKDADLVRPPYGAINAAVRENVKAPLILWSVDTLDWDSQDAEEVKKVIRSKIKDGDIILMHDIYKSTVQATREILPELIEEGYQFLTVSELAEYRGVEMKDGQKYSNFYK